MAVTSRFAQSAQYGFTLISSKKYSSQASLLFFNIACPCILFSTPLISIKIPISVICSHLLSVAWITIPTVFCRILISKLLSQFLKQLQLQIVFKLKYRVVHLSVVSYSLFPSKMNMWYGSDFFAMLPHNPLLWQHFYVHLLFLIHTCLWMLFKNFLMLNCHFGLWWPWLTFLAICRLFCGLFRSQTI